MASPTDLARMVPGFDFLQGLLKNAGSGLPSMGQWIAPTLDPAELEKRIRELKTVHFWLEQNARLMATTIQALEVQRMTLSTLQGMNLPMAGLADALKIKTPAGASPSPEAETNEREAAPASKAARGRRAPAPAAAAAIVDPLQWWGALTQQFTELATQAVKDSAADTARSMAGAMVKGSLDSAGDALRKAVAMPGQAAQAALKAATAPRPAARQRAASSSVGRSGKPARKR